ncbi:MAG: hypothetical protein OEY34_03170, partial [Cyclobacteriaceae bacterium]|nr:hypothetical protein [Cyclobacteriaceae bacterium]
MYRFLIYISVFAIAFGCDSKKPSEEEILKKLSEKEDVSDAPAVDTEMINGILQQIPSPLEISMLLKESGTKYDPTILNSANNLPKYNTNYQKALNLGIYGTDLGYTNIYERNQDGLEYMTSIKELADGLSIGQFFDVETIGRLATNSKNLDSLLLITTQNFNNINSYLQTQGRSNLSVLLLVGGWMEALHVTLKTADKNPGNTQLRDAIGEQQIVLESINMLLTLYKDSDANMARLAEDLQPLMDEYATINIEVIKG